MTAWLGSHWRDIVDLVSVVATVAAAWLAWKAIVRGNEQAKASADSIVRERRIDFELDHLDSMSDAIEKGENVAFTSLTIARGLRLLPEHEFTRLWARYLPPGPELAMREVQALNERSQAFPGEASLWSTDVLKRLEDAEEGERCTYRQALRQEVLDAIQMRLDQR